MKLEIFTIFRAHVSLLNAEPWIYKRFFVSEKYIFKKCKAYIKNPWPWLEFEILKTFKGARLSTERRRLSIFLGNALERKAKSVPK